MIILICSLIVVVGALIIFSIVLHYKVLHYKFIYSFNNVPPKKLRIRRRKSIWNNKRAYVLEQSSTAYVWHGKKWKKLFTFSSRESAIKYLKKEEERISKGTSLLKD